MRKLFSLVLVVLLCFGFSGMTRAENTTTPPGAPIVNSVGSDQGKDAPDADKKVKKGKKGKKHGKKPKKG